MGVASNKTNQVAVLSINPRYAEQILTGNKRVEFRKTRINESISHVIIYATSPRSEVVGFFEVDNIEEGNPVDFWKRYHKISGLHEEDYWAYYQRTCKGYAIHIGHVYVLSHPQPLKTLLGYSIIPQSFCYTGKECVEYLFKYVTKLESRKSNCWKDRGHREKSYIT